MEIQDIQRKERKEVIMTIRTYPKCSKWMKENNISPTLIFNKAIEELMKKE